ncbi:MAG TPA: hypothetical protein VFB38_13325 [Chthonomonadaceae bacterium]|nr:hypothetical protein [Chthonomonadaceae bacterium]
MRSYVLFLPIVVLGIHSGLLQSRITKRELPEPAHPAWMETDPSLQRKVTIDFKGRPLRVVLASIRQRVGVNILAARNLEEFRVSLHVTAQPLGRVMGRLQDLFGHGTLPTKSCYWVRIEDTDHSIRYILRRTLYGAREEEALLNYPITTVTRWLHELRDYGQLPPEKRKDFKSDCPVIQYYASQGRGMTDGNDPVGEAIASLTDAQIEELITNGQVELPQFAPSIGAINKMRTTALESGISPKAGENAPPSGAMLRFDSTEGWIEGAFTIMLSFRSGFPTYYPSGYGLDTLSVMPTQEDMQALEEAQQKENGPEVDLLAHEQVVPDKEPVMSLAAALELLAREAKLRIYAEVFLKSRQTLPVTRGKPEYLLSQICRVFQCDWRKIGGDYLVWSKS